MELKTNGMDKDELICRLICLLLLNKGRNSIDTFSLEKTMSRWFDVVDYRSYTDKLVSKDILVRENVDGNTNYQITNLGIHYFYNDLKQFEKEISLLYKDKKNILDSLLDNISRSPEEG